MRTLAQSAGVLAALIFLLPTANAFALDIENHYSPRNQRRPGRKSTRYIILHTTEGAEKGSLYKLHRDGEAHYMVGRSGKVYRIIDKNRVARHAGTSMWNGLTNLDHHSIGIEIVGFHNGTFPARQMKAVRELLRQLQAIYNVADANVLTHSMIAYGRPNKYHRRSHRGRKRCAMNLADHRVRRKLGLTAHRTIDPDVRSGRLVVADPVLEQRLYPKGAPLPSEQIVLAEKSTPKAPPKAQPRSREKPKSRSSSQPHVAKNSSIREVDGSGRSARAVAGNAFDDSDTIYMFPSGLVRSGRDLAKSSRYQTLLRKLPAGTRVFLGYQNGGYVSATRPPSVICGEKWRDITTLYRYPNGELLRGSEIRPESIPKQTLVFFKG